MNDPHEISRRRFCMQSFGLPLVGLLAGNGQALAGERKAQWGSRKLIIVTLNGGNDGLNTVVPWRNPVYRALRPQLAIHAKDVLPFNSELGFHPSLKGLRAAYEKGDVGIIQGIGWPEADLSHFVSMDRWNAGHLQTAGMDGWFARVVNDNISAFEEADFDAGAVVLNADAGFTTGKVVSVLTETLVPGDGKTATYSDSPVAKEHLGQLAMDGLGQMQLKPKMPASMQLLAMQVRQADLVGQRLSKRLGHRSLPPTDYKATGFQQQAHTLGWLIREGIHFPVARLALGGFDTHSLQAERHGDLLTELDGVLTRLRQQLVQDGSWDNTLILVQSEFGRRVAEHSGGTDHGTAGVAFMMGGKVRGGVYGPNPNLNDLDAFGNLRYAIDFRSMYSTVVSDWWALGVNQFSRAGFNSLGILSA